MDKPLTNLLSNPFPLTVDEYFIMEYYLDCKNIVKIQTQNSLKISFESFDKNVTWLFIKAFK